MIRNLTSADCLLASVMHSAYFEAPKDNHRFVYLLSMFIFFTLWFLDRCKFWLNIVWIEAKSNSYSLSHYFENETEVFFSLVHKLIDC